MFTKLRSDGRRIWQLLSSIKTGVILLIVVVIVSAAGTLILQRPITDPDEMQRAYSPQMLRFLDIAGLTDVYHAWWFVLLLVLVSVSIVAASIQRFPNAWRYFSRPYKSPDDAFRKALATQKQFPIPDEETGLVAAERALRKGHFRPERVVGAERMSLFAERNRLSEMAVYIVHASLLLIFLGGIIDGLFGWRGSVTLVRGQQVSDVVLPQGSRRQLPFTLRCDGAGQENYTDGTPKRWWSKLAVLENGREISRKEIVVNDPLVYRGVRFYQASYGMNGQVDKLLLTATPQSAATAPREIALGLDQTVDLDTNVSVRLARFIPDFVVRDGQIYTRSQEPANPAVQLLVSSKQSGKTTEVWLPEISGFSRNQDSPYAFEPRDLQMAYFTGLQVSHEPGQWAVWSGCLLMGLGLAAAFYLVHTRLWVVPVRDARGQLVLWIGGVANKNQPVFEERFAALTQDIQSELKELSKTRPEARMEVHSAALAGD